MVRFLPVARTFFVDFELGGCNFRANANHHSHGADVSMELPFRSCRVALMALRHLSLTLRDSFDWHAGSHQLSGMKPTVALNQPVRYAIALNGLSMSQSRAPTAFSTASATMPLVPDLTENVPPQRIPKRERPVWRLAAARKNAHKILWLNSLR
jgi:hypothetical protein